EHRRDHSELSTLELLRLAAELAAADETRPLVADMADSDSQEIDDNGPAIAATGWLGDLLQGLPDTALAEGDEPPGFVATLRPYQRRGLGWLQFLYQLGLGGCLADDMGLGKTPTPLAHSAALPGSQLAIGPLSV